MIYFLNVDSFFQTIKNHGLKSVKINGSIAKNGCFELHSSYDEKTLKKIVKEYDLTIDKQ